MAYVSVRRYDGLDADTIPQIAEKVEESGFGNTLRGITGFLGYYMIAGDDGTGMTVSVFETQAGAEESIQRAAEMVGAEFRDLIPNPPQITNGELLLEVTPE